MAESGVVDPYLTLTAAGDTPIWKVCALTDRVLTVREYSVGDIVRNRARTIFGATEFVVVDGHDTGRRNALDRLSVESAARVDGSHVRHRRWRYALSPSTPIPVTTPMTASPAVIVATVEVEIS